ncbi:hypothetical protein GOODEAATRI_030945, partial [Goodea atripinnis]
CSVPFSTVTPATLHCSPLAGSVLSRTAEEKRSRGCLKKELTHAPSVSPSCICSCSNTKALTAGLRQRFLAARVMVDKPLVIAGQFDRD